ncbi:MAG: cyclic nucleotide-binding domain-containing protein, partial [Deltaproteobacteria bacterium]|nr:cyclic nucleotide-binding domain-containing protein [Deltaproteobacteria bacterium]
IASKVPEGHLRKIALKEGMHTLRQDGLLKCQQGMTTLEQVLEKTVIQKESLPHYLLNPDEMVFENGDTIIKEGNTDTSFYKLIQGCLDVFKGQNLIAEISQTNTYFGEMSALVGSRRSATIKSKGRSIVKVFPGDKLGEVLENYPDISKQIIDTLVLRLNESSNRLSEIMQNRIELERTYVTQLTASASSAGMPTSNRPIAGLPKGQAGPNIAMSTKGSALARLAAKASSAQAPAKPAPGGGNGSAGPAVIKPIARPESPGFAQTSLAGSQPKPAQIQARPAQAGSPPPAAPQAIKPISLPPKPVSASPAPVVIPEIQFDEVPVTAVPSTAEPPSPSQAAVASAAPKPTPIALPPRPALGAQPPKVPATIAPGSPAKDPANTRSSFIRNLMPADQTQLVIVKDSAPAAKILREVR